MSDPIGYHENFAHEILTPFRAAVLTLQPTATGTDVVRLLDYRAKRTTVLQWMAGRAHPPRWALELLAAKLTARGARDLAIAERARRQPERIGQGGAGAKNLAAWKARQSKQNDNK